MKKRYALLIFLFLYLLLFPQTATDSARAGLLLWYHSVLPSLFPFMFLSNLTLRLLRPDQLPKIIFKPLSRLFGCSAYGTFAILAGFLCGFPMGAKITSNLYHEKKISREEAFFLYGFVNNMSPGFILSYLAAEQMQLPRCAGWFLLQILGAALIYGWLSAPRDPGAQPGLTKPEESSPVSESGLSFSLIDDCIYDAVNSTLRLCAYIMLFAILSGAAMQFIPAEAPAALFLIAGIEVTNGIRLLAKSSLPFAVKYAAVTALSAFGGLSALVQSAGIAHMGREFLLHYIKCRLKITILAVLFSVLILFSLIR